jgi:TolB-like protein/Tfp pilus assembly protein PilF
MAAERSFLLPVVIDDVGAPDARVPDRFCDVHWTNLPGGATPRDFVDRVARLLATKEPFAATGHPNPAAGSLRPALPARNAGSLPAVEKSIAVLPFTNLSSDKDNEYFSDGLAEEILNALSRVPELRVAAHSSTFSFRNKGASVAEIGERLHVANILEGSVRRAADRLRITVQLVDAQTGFHQWSERYDRQLSDIFEVQDEIAQAIAERLKVTLASIDTRPTTNVEAYELYLRGRHEWHQRSPTTMRAAIKNFERSIKLDANNALAFAGLADCYAILSVFGWMPPADARGPAYEAVQRAVTLAPNLWEINYSRGLHIFTFDPAWRSARPYFEKAAAINPRSALAHSYLGIFLAMADVVDEAIAEIELGRQLDPLSVLSHGFASESYSMLGRHEAAESASRTALELQPDSLYALWQLAKALSRQERYEEAIPYFERTVQLSRAPFYVGLLGYALARAGRADEARRLLAELDDRGSRGEFIPIWARLNIYAGLGDVATVRTVLAAAPDHWTPPLTMRVTLDLWSFHTDPEIERMRRDLFGS